MTGTIADLVAGYSLDLAGMALDGDNFAGALRAGAAIASDMAHGAMDLTIDVVEPAGTSRVTAVATGGGLTVMIDEAGLQYGLSGTGTALTLSGPEIPFPELKLNYAEIAMNLVMPLLASPEPGEFALLTRFVDLSVSEDLWAMIDPTGVLPHDPATLILDTKGTARLTTDLVDEAAMATLGQAAPGEIQSLDLTELTLTAAGAALTGSGAVTFDNTDLVTFDGVPAPTGRIDMQLRGGNGLLDRLVTMGVLSGDDANGARLMLSLFANAGPGEDELTSTIEFKDKGLFANGQRLQ
jgi:hypothetical protein